MVTTGGTHLSKEDKEWLKTMSKEQLFINYREQKKMTDKLQQQVNVISGGVIKWECVETKDLISVCDYCCTQLCQAGM